MENFFCDFAKSIQVIPRQSKNGDYYGNCLKLLGIEIDIPVRPRRLREAMKMSSEDKQWVKERVAPLFFLEANLAVFSTTAEQSDFFDGIEEFVGIKGFRGIDGTSTENAHAVESKTYDWLLQAALALIWSKYRQLNLTLPTDSFLDVHVIQKIIASETDFGTVLNTYKALLPTLEKRISLLDKNLANFSINSSRVNTCKFIHIRGPYKTLLGNRLQVSFKDMPFGHFFHKVKKMHTLNFKTPTQNYFIFYSGHSPQYSLLFKTLLLLDLNEGLKHASQYAAANHSTYSWQQIMAQEIKQPDRLAEQLRTESRRVAGPSRLAVAGEKHLAHEEKVSADYVFVDRSKWQEPEGDSLFAVWQTELTVPEETIDRYTGDRALLNIDAFYFNGDTKAQISCELIGEYDQDNNAVFCIGLDKFRIDELGFKPDETRSIAGFTGEPGEGWLVVVFEAE